MVVKAVFDTNILIDYLNGVGEAADELKQFSERVISIVTVMEVMVGARSEEEASGLHRFLSGFRVVELGSDVANEAVALRKQLGLKIPDAVVYATARREGCLLVTRDDKDMKPDWPDVRIPYRLAD